MKNTIITTCLSLIFASVTSAQTFSDDFIRGADVALTSNGTDIGPNWVIERGEFGISDATTEGIVITDTTGESMMFNTTVGWADAVGESSTASVITNTGGVNLQWSGISFNVQPGINDDNYYLFRYRSDSKNYQILEMDNGLMSQALRLQSDATVTFDANTDYELTVSQTFGGAYTFTITEAGSSTVLNPVTTFSDSTYTGGFAGVYHGNPNDVFEWKEFSMSTIPEPNSYALMGGLLAGGIAFLRRRSR
jgi:hypothetical protein